MANELLMALGLTVPDDGKAASLKMVLNEFTHHLEFSEIETNKATITFDSYEDAEELINYLYSYSENTQFSDKTGLQLNIILIDSQTTSPQARAIAMLGNIEQKKTASGHLVDVYITPEVYGKLLPKYQDLYRPPIQIGNNSVHQRFSSDVQRCFVVSPIGPPESAIRNRADLVFEKYIKPGCENTPYRPVRGDMMRGREITPEFMDAVHNDPMVIVYLGPPKPEWNPNVIYELGLRGDAPYVALKDATSEGTAYELPFDLKDKRIVEIPEHLKPESDPGVEVRTIRERLLESVPPTWGYLYPGATIDVKVGGPDGASKFVDAPKELEILFELTGIRGKSLAYVIGHLMKKMPAYQRQPFLDEQSRLIGQLVVNFGPNNINATIPIIFETHLKYAGRAFLPIIVGYHFYTVTNILRLRVLYLDVTGVTKKNHGDEYYTCSLISNEPVH
jgi:hypothetical protein